MTKLFSIPVFLLLAFSVALPAACCRASVRPPAVAGQFYTEDQSALTAQINYFLGRVPASGAEGVIAIVVPHAGYDFSGQTAAYAYSLIKNSGIKTVVIVGASHKKDFEGIAFANYDFFETPLGRVEVDMPLSKKIAGSLKFSVFDDSVHRDDHVIEVQLPFLQTVLGRDFKIVPIIFGRFSPDMTAGLAQSLAKNLYDGAIVIASTDWSHYNDAVTAGQKDSVGINFVLKNDPDSFFSSCVIGSTEACSLPAVLTVMLYANERGATSSRLLHRATSADATKDPRNVVGYASLIFARSASLLNAAQRKKLIGIAKNALHEKLTKGEVPQITETDAALQEKQGVFVTLKKNGQLRGCIGFTRPIEPLYLAVRDMAIAAAEQDARFKPVRVDELKDIKIEISVLSAMKKVDSLDEIMIGRDGLFMVKGTHSGILLPQVPAENGWDLKAYLQNLSLKAGIAYLPWDRSSTQLYKFTAQIFEE